MSVTERLGGWLADRTSRRSFLARSTMAATALSVAPADLLLRPGTAYASICDYHGYECACGSLCGDGYTQFCCTINDGVNACPQGSFPGGWWQASGSEYCSGLRYYIDCQGECTACGCTDGSAFCGEDCDNVHCECALGNCANRAVGCNTFRYGQCNQQIGCSGRILCRVVTCTPPWEIYDCTTVAQTDNSTADHYAPCQGGPGPTGTATIVGMAARPQGDGYWIAGSDGSVFAFGSAPNQGNALADHPVKPIVGMAATPSGEGYWLVASDGGVFSYGDARFYGSAGDLRLVEPVVGMAASPAGTGYWLVAADGGIFTYDVRFEGSEGGHPLNRPVVGMAATANGEGYWLVASDGGIFSLGDARYYGSTGDLVLARPVVGMAARPQGDGYWLVASDGGIFTFGGARFWGSEGGHPLDRPVVGMAASPSGDGYWLVASDGGIFTFGDARYYGALPPRVP